MAQRPRKRARALEIEPRSSPRVKRRAPSPIVDKENIDPLQLEYTDSSSHLTLAAEGTLRASTARCHPSNGQSPLVGKAPLQEVPDTPSRGRAKRQRPDLLDDEACPIQLPTPKTPRHRDALSQKVQITPRHRQILIKTLTPRTSRTQQALSPHKKADSVYGNARKQFVVATKPEKLIGRDHEREQLHEILNEGLLHKRGACLYISGPPGTGKSALVREVCEGLSQQDVTTIYLNCMSISNSEDLVAKLGGDLSGDDVFYNGNCEAGMSKLRARFTCRSKSRKTNYLVVLDEVDNLLNMDLEVIYMLFEWALRKDTTLSLITIANALDLTHRFLPRLKARNLTPQLLPLLPYTSRQIEAIITSRLQSLLPDQTEANTGFTPFMHPSAIQLCSKKVASQSGDLRKAFDIARHAIDAVEAEAVVANEGQRIAGSDFLPSKSPLSDKPNMASPSQRHRSCYDSATRISMQTAPRATIAHVSRISATVLSHGTSQRLASATIQQKVILAAIIRNRQTGDRAVWSLSDRSKSRQSSRTCKQVYRYYSDLCEREKSLQSLTFSEFADVLSSLESIGLVCEEKGSSSSYHGTPSKGGRGGDRRILCLVNARDLLQSLKGAQSDILNVMINET